MRNVLPLTSFLRPLPVASWLGCGLFVLTPVATAAELYKCAGDGGIPVYQNMPCEKGKELRNMSNEDTLSVVPMRVEPSRLPPSAPAPAAVMPPPPSPPPAATTGSEPAVRVQLLPADSLPASKETEHVLGNVPSTPLLPPADASLPGGEPLGITAVARMAIKPGMTAAEVEAKLGPPPMTGGADSDAPNQPVRWFYLPTEGDRDTITTIVLQGGKVTDVERKPMKKDH